MHRRIAGLALLGLTLTGCNAASLWTMDETSGTAMVDATGDNDGTTADVGRGTPSYDGSGFYTFNGSSSIARVPDAPSLDPGAADFSFGAHVRFTAVPPATTFDVIRKGVAGSQYYKLELFDSGTTKGVRARCYMIGSEASASVVLGENLNDGVWRELSCSRTGQTIRLDLVTNGTKRSNFQTRTVGSIANDSPLTIGAKPTPGDFYQGAIDDATVSVG